jgi:hypothetical protein
MLKPKSLRQAYMVYWIVPIVLLLSSMGAAGFIVASNYLIRQWQQTTLLQAMTAALADFRGDSPPSDDVTLVVVKLSEIPSGI